MGSSSSETDAGKTLLRARRSIAMNNLQCATQSGTTRCDTMSAERNSHPSLGNKRRMAAPSQSVQRVAGDQL
jgi:hypothetical protein